MEVSTYRDAARSSSRGPDEEALFGAVARRFGPALNSFFRRRLGREPDECEDLTQEVFLRLIKREQADTIRDIEPYVFQTAAAVLVDHVRRRSTRPHGAADPFDELAHEPEEFSPERVMLGKEQVARALAAIEALPERARHAVILFRFEGLRQAEIARRMKISVSAVEKHIRLGMVRIAAAVQDEP